MIQHSDDDDADDDDADDDDYDMIWRGKGSVEPGLPLGDEKGNTVLYSKSDGILAVPNRDSRLPDTIC